MPFCVLLLTSEMHIKKSDPDILFRILPLSFSLRLYLFVCPASSRALIKVCLWGWARLGLCKLACLFEKGNYGVSRSCWCFGAEVLTRRSPFGSSRLWRGSVGSCMACVCHGEDAACWIPGQLARHGDMPECVMLLEFDYKVKRGLTV